MVGHLITFEGTEGAGKSTLIRTLAQRIAEEWPDRPITQTREPGGSTVAEQIRQVILGNPMDPWTELFLYEAARAEHLAKTILPALQSGHCVLCDRYTDSSLAYQSHARGLPWDAVKRLNRIATRSLQPQLTVLLDVDPEAGLLRAKDPNRFEKEGIDFQKKVRAGFLKSKRENPKRWLVLKVEGRSPEELATTVMKRMVQQFRWKNSRG